MNSSDTGRNAGLHPAVLSFIIPAHNEAAWIGRCVEAIHAAAGPTQLEYEVIVVDDFSTDGTADIAGRTAARVIHVEYRHIAATRNAGVKEAHGSIFFFVDADTLVNRSVVESALRSISGGAAGGGCLPQFEGKIPLWWRLFYPFFVRGARLLNQTGGCCLFCKREAFEAVGGFSEAHFAAEDALFVAALKRHGRFALLRETVITSGRSLRAHSMWTIGRILLRLARRGPDGFRKREGLELWYSPPRE